MVNVKFAVLGDSFVDVVAGTLAPDQLPKWGGDVECSRPIQLQPGGSALNTATHIGKLALGHPHHALTVELHSVVGTRPVCDALSFTILYCNTVLAMELIGGAHRHGRVRPGDQGAPGGARRRTELARARGRPHGRVHRPQRNGTSAVGACMIPGACVHGVCDCAGCSKTGASSHTTELLASSELRYALIPIACGSRTWTPPRLFLALPYGVHS